MDPVVVRDQLARGELAPVLEALVALWGELRSPRLASTIEGLASIARVDVDPRIDRRAPVAGVAKEPRPDDAAAIRVVVEWLRDQRKQPPWRAARDAMWAAIFANPTDLALRQVLGDQLLERGDPFGELITLTAMPPATRSHEARARELELVRTIGVEVYGPIMRAVDLPSLTLVGGFFESCSLNEWPRTRKALPLVTLRELAVEYSNMSVTRLAGACPVLRKVRLHDGSLRVLLSEGHPTLERIEVHFRPWLDAARFPKTADFPSLRAVHVDVTAYRDAERMTSILTSLTESVGSLLELSVSGALASFAVWAPIMATSGVRRFTFIQPMRDEGSRWTITMLDGGARVEARLFGDARASWWQRRRLKAHLPPDVRDRIHFV